MAWLRAISAGGRGAALSKAVLLVISHAMKSSQRCQTDYYMWPAMRLTASKPPTDGDEAYLISIILACLHAIKASLQPNRGIDEWRRLRAE